MQLAQQEVLSRQIALVTAQSNQAGVLVTADVGFVVLLLLLVIMIVRRDFSDQVRHYIQIVDEQKRELERANRELSELAMRDGLTGLINHRTFHERLADEFTRAERQMSTTSLLMIDVDHFKQYNDSYGHPAGDALLRRLAALLSDSARSCDVVARYGGEEFAILLPVTDTSGALDLAERLRKRVEGENWQSAVITVSIGVAASGYGRYRAADLLCWADRALYQSKANGRNRVTLAAMEELSLA
jgi:diguanylate cyclase (GGDEF)-like protein